MKKAPPVRLSLRKLFIAMLAVGPVAILPSPVLAALPTYTQGTNSGSFTVTNGSVSSTSGTGIIQAADRSVLVWGTGNFNIASGETFNFQVPGGSVLNKVGYAGSSDTAVINGTLLSSGRVFVLANGSINVGGTAQINTQGGLYLSTLAETNDFAYTTSGNLSFSGASQGSITLGNGTSAVSVVNGSLAAFAGTVTTNNLAVSGDLILNQTGSGTGLSLVGVGGPTTVGGNLTVVTNNGAVTQSRLLTVAGTTSLSTGTGNVTLDYQGIGSATVGVAGSGFTAAPTVTISGGGGSGATATATLNTSGGVASVTVTNAGSGFTGTPTITISGGGGTNATATLAKVLNDFGTVQATTANTSNVTVLDRSDIAIGASSLGNLSVSAAGNVSTSGAVVAAGAVTFNSTGTGNVTFANGSSAGSFASSVANGSVTVNAVGNLTVGNITTGGGILDALTLGNGGSGYTVAPTVVISGGGGSGATATATINTSGAVTSVTITNVGTGYTAAPSISFTGGGAQPGTAATASVSISSSIQAVNTTINTTSSGGAGYNMTFTPAVLVVGGGGTGATVNPVWTGGVLTSVTIVNPGSGYTAAPTIALAGISGTDYPTPVIPIGTISLPLAGGTVATGTVSAGTGYTGAPTVTINAGGGGSGATATSPAPNTAGALSGSLTIGAGGSGFTAAPTVTLTGGGTNPSSFGSASSAVAPNGGNVTIAASGIATLANNISGGNVAVTAASINATGGVVSTNGTASYVSTGGNLNVGNTVARTISINATGGNVTQIGTLSHISGNGSNSAPTTVINAGSTGNVTLSNNNTLKGVVQLTGANVALANSGNLTIGTTVTSGNLAVTTTANATGNIAIGTGFGTAVQNLTVGGNLALTTNNSTITDDSYASQYVFGTTTINTASSGAGGAAATLNAAAANSNGLASGRFGQLNANLGTGSLVYSENTSINVGNITGNSITVRSVNSDIVINGTIAATTVSLNANTNSITESATGLISGGSVTVNTASNTAFGSNLSNASNSFTAISVTNGGNNIIVNNATFNLTGNSTTGNTSVTNVNAASTTSIATTNNFTNLTVRSEGQVVVNSTSSGNYARLNITSNNTSASAITLNGSNGAFNVNNTLTLSTLGGVTSNNNANITSVVLNNVVGDATINATRNLTVSGTISGNLSVGAGQSNSTVTAQSFFNPWNLFLGNLSVGKDLTARASNGGQDSAVNGIGGTITQVAGSSIHVESNATFTTYNNDITVANNNNSAGRLAFATGGLNTAGTGNVVYSEDSTAKVGNITTNGTVNLTSRFGSIIEDATANDSYVVRGALTLNAPNGSIQLDGTSHTTGTTSADVGTISLTAAGAAKVISTNNVVLGASAANSLSVTANVITQSAPLNVFGAAAFVSGNGITLDNSANNFGPISATVTTGGRNIVLTEANTLNLRTVAMPAGGNGTFTATSLNGDIIDTGLGGAKMGGNVSGTGSGVVTLSAVNGNVIIDDPTSDFLTTSGVVFNGKNVTLSILGSPTTSLVIGAAGVGSSASGNFVASSALGSIANAGSFTVGGNAFFQATNGNIVINQPSVNFGTLKFIGQTVSIAESSNMDIQTGSASFGIASLTSNGGNISVVDAGGGVVSFGSTGTLLASGNITLSKVQAVNTLTVNAAGTKDLSALSLSADLNSKTPVDLGTGAGPSTVPALAPKP
jgi:hypothetical protein